MDEVKRFLEQHYKLNITDIKPIKHGEWSDAFFFNMNRDEFVFRFSQLQENFLRDKYMEKFASLKLPIPQIIEIGKISNGYYSISKKVKGKHIDILSRNEFDQVLPAVLGMLDEMRNANISKTSGYGGVQVDGNGEFSSWRKYLQNIGMGSAISNKEKLKEFPKYEKLFNDLYKRMLSLIDACPEDRYLIHGDLLYFNLLIQNSKIAGVIDWGCAKYGDYLYDIAWFSFWGPWHEALKHVNFRKKFLEHVEKIGLTIENYEKRMDCYELHIALDSILYSAFKGRWEQVEKVGEQVSKILV